MQSAGRLTVLAATAETIPECVPEVAERQNEHVTGEDLMWSVTVSVLSKID